jgi:hypothetical protein
MIITKIMGGLGNQLFQWSNGVSLSKKYDINNVFDINFYNSQNLRKFSLYNFENLKIDLLDKTKTDQYSNIIRISDDLNFGFQSISLDRNTNYYIDGYFQSEKYFHDHEYIRNKLSPNDLNKLIISKKYPQIIENCVSLHVRRTDYLSSNGHHPIQTISYYKESLSLLEYDYILIFSDDIKWCKENLSFDNMIFIEGNEDIIDLWIMSLCQNNIIANSTFSWWGAWLNRNPDKKVIAPSNWFGDQINLNTSDLLPESWIKIISPLE